MIKKSRKRNIYSEKNQLKENGKINIINIILMTNE